MSYSYSAAVEASLDALAERDIDPTVAVYERLFSRQPDMKALFWRDADGSIKGEMLSRVFAAVLDFIGERRYAGHMIGTELVTHEGYDVPREVFATFFGVVAETLKDLLAADWTPEMDGGWRQMLVDIEHYVSGAPRTDGVRTAVA